MTSIGETLNEYARDFYARFGWEPAPSFHISLPPCPKAASAALGVHDFNDLRVSRLAASDLPPLCLRDEELVKRELQSAVD